MFRGSVGMKWDAEIDKCLDGWTILRGLKQLLNCGPDWHSRLGGNLTYGGKVAWPRGLLTKWLLIKKVSGRSLLSINET